MPIYCPHCATPSNIRGSVGSAGRMARCAKCGTTWLARVFDEDPYGRSSRALAVPADVSDAIVIDHVGAGFKPRPSSPAAGRSRSRPRVAANRSRYRIAGALAAVAVALLVLGGPLAAGLPRLTAGATGLPDNVSQLAFRKVRSETIMRHGVSTLFVEGEIVNRSARDVALPAVRIALKSSDGAEVSSWLVELATAGLAAGRSIGFRSALASPPSAATQVTLNLAHREGQTIGLR